MKSAHLALNTFLQTFDKLVVRFAHIVPPRRIRLPRAQRIAAQSRFLSFRFCIRTLLVVVAASLVFVVPAGTASADALQVGSVATLTPTGSSFSVSHTVPAGSDRMLVVIISCKDKTQTVTSVNWNTTETLTNFHASYDFWTMEAFRLLNPTVTTTNVDVVMSTTGDCAVTVVNFAGVDQTTPIDLPVITNLGGGSPPTVSVATATGDLVMDFVTIEDTITVGTGQTQMSNLQLGGGTGNYGGVSIEASGTPVTMDWTAAGGDFDSVGFNINKVLLARTSTLALGDSFVLGLPRTSGATASDLFGFTATFTRTTDVLLGDTSSNAVTFPRASSATLGDDSDLGFPRTSPFPTMADSFQQVITFGRTSAGSLGDTSQNAAAFARVSAATLGETAGLGLPRTSAATLIGTFGLGFPRTSAVTAGDAAQSAAAFTRSSAATVADPFSLGFPGTSIATLSDTSQQAAAFPKTSAATLGDTYQSAATFARASAATLGGTADLTLPGASAATLTGTFDLGFPRTSAVTAGDAAQNAAVFTRSTAVTIGDVSQSDLGLPGNSSANLGDASQQAASIPRTSLAAFNEAAQQAAAFTRSTAVTVGDVHQNSLAFPKTSQSTFVDTFGLGLLGISVPILGDTSQQAASLPRTSASALSESAQQAAAFPRSSAVNLGDVFALSQGLSSAGTSATTLGDAFQSALNFQRSSAGTLGDVSALTQGQSSAGTSATTLGDAFQSALAFPRKSTGNLGDVSALTQGLSAVETAAATFGDVSTSAVAFPKTSPTTLGEVSQSALIFPRSLDATLGDTSMLGFSKVSGAGMSESMEFTVARNFVPPISPAPGDDFGASAFDDASATNFNLVAHIVDFGGQAAKLLVYYGQLDSSATGSDLAEAAGIDAMSAAEALVVAADISTEITGDILAGAANDSLGTLAILLVASGRLDTEATGRVIVAAAEIAPLATSKAVVAAANIDAGVIQAALGAGIAGDPSALAVLGVEIPSESFVPENPPIEGTNPSTGEFWQLVGTHPIIEQILVRFLEPIPNAHLEVTDYSVLPDGVAPLPPGELANAYFSFTARNFDDGDIRATHLSFSVEKSWLRDNLINPWSVRFNRYDEDRRTWVLLDAKRVGEDELLVHYTAYPPGFSHLAISGSPDPRRIGYRVENLRIDPPEIRERQEVTVEAQVINLGTTTIYHNLTLWLNGMVEASQTMEVPPNTALPVSFVLTPREGVYEVRIDRLVGRLLVGAPPQPPTSSPHLIFGTTSTERTMTVANPAEGAPLEYTVTTDQPWLTANPARFRLSPGTFQAVTLSVDRTGLPSGTYDGQADVYFTGLISGRSIVTVAMEVPEAGVPPVISPTLDLGPTGTSGTTIVSNPLTGASLRFTIISHVPWLTAASTDFVLAPGANQAVVLLADRKDLDVGFHTGMLTVAYSGAISGISVIAVALEVPAPAPPPLAPPVVNVRLDLGASGTGGIITVSTPIGSGPLEYAITANQPWLTATPTNFVVPSGESRAITVSVDRDGLDFGRHSAEVAIAFTGATSGSTLVPVTIEKLTPPPTPVPPTVSPGRGFEFWALILIGFGAAGVIVFGLFRWVKGRKSRWAERAV